MRTKLALLISQMEGFGKPGAIPTVRNNPGDLRHGPHAKHYEGIGIGEYNSIGWYDTVELGWSDLERQLTLYAMRGLTLDKLVMLYAPPTENDSENYLRFLCEGLGYPYQVPMDNITVRIFPLVSECLKIMA
jgi:hypothetical protein